MHDAEAGLDKRRMAELY